MGIDAATSSSGVGRIQPVNFIPPDGDWAFCLGSDAPGLLAILRHNEEQGITQTADFDTTEVLRFRARTRGPVRVPRLVKVTATATQTYTVTINSVAHDYVADTTGLLFESGSAASIDDREGDLTTIGGLTNMTAASVGRRMVISGAATGANNGTFPIDEFVDENTVKVRNPAGVPGDANDGSISWEERRRPDNDTTIALGLRDAIAAGSQPVSARVFEDGLLQIDVDDPDDTNTFAVGTSLSLHTIEWKFAMLIDGSVRAEQLIRDRSSRRDRFDMGTLLTNLGAGDHDLEFRLQVTTVPSLTSARFEMELPAVYVDQLVAA